MSVQLKLHSAKTSDEANGLATERFHELLKYTVPTSQSHFLAMNIWRLPTTTLKLKAT